MPGRGADLVQCERGAVLVSIGMQVVGWWLGWVRQCVRVPSARTYTHALTRTHITTCMQVIVLDDKEVGSYMDIWQRLSHPHPVLQLSQTPLPEGVCLPHVLASPFVDHAISLFTYQNSHATDVQCSSVELRGLSLWLRYLYRNLMPPGAAYAATRAAVQQHQQRSTPRLWSWLRSNAMHGRLLAASDAQQLALAAALEGAVAGARAQHARMLQQLHSAPQVPGVRHVGVLWISRAHFEASMEGKLTDWQKNR